MFRVFCTVTVLVLQAVDLLLNLSIAFCLGRRRNQIIARSISSCIRRCKICHSSRGARLCGWGRVRVCGTRGIHRRHSLTRAKFSLSLFLETSLHERTVLFLVTSCHIRIVFSASMERRGEDFLSCGVSLSDHQHPKFRQGPLSSLRKA